MSERLISQLQSFLDRIKNDTRSALMFEADADTLREAMARIKADGMKVDRMMNEADKDVIRIAALERDLTQAVQMYTDAAGERDKALADLAAAQADLREHIALCLEANKLIDNAQAERDALRERANALLHQIDIGDYVDSEGHALKNNIAVLTLMKALTNV